jgi:hypothetical protein
MKHSPLPMHRAIPVSLPSSPAANVFLFFLLLLGLTTSGLFAGSWPMERRATFLSIGYRGFSGQHYYGQHGEEIGLQRLEEQTLSLYSEYGYSKYVTGIVQIPAFRKLYAQLRSDTPLLSVQSPGDVDLGLRFAIWPGDHDVVTVTGLFGIPLGEATQGAGLWAGDDEYNQLVKVGYGHDFEEIPLYALVEGGYNFRSGGYSDEVHFGAEVGIRPWDPLQLTLSVRSVNSQGNGDPSFLGGGFGFSSNNQRYLMYGPELAFWVTPDMGVNVGFYSYSQARNTTSATVITSGVFFVITPPTQH